MMSKAISLECCLLKIRDAKEKDVVLFLRMCVGLKVILCLLCVNCNAGSHHVVLLPSLAPLGYRLHQHGLTLTDGAMPSLAPLGYRLHKHGLTLTDGAPVALQYIVIWFHWEQ